MVFVIRLSGFQLLMSLLGSIGSVIEGLGLRGSMEIIYTLVTQQDIFYQSQRSLR